MEFIDIYKHLKEELSKRKSFKVEFYIGTSRQDLDIIKINNKIYDVLKDMLASEDIVLEGGIEVSPDEIKESITDPFTGMDLNIQGKLTAEDLIRAIRLDIIAEEDAVQLYRAHANATTDERAKKLLNDIADEEVVHIGEFQKLIDVLTGAKEKELQLDGEKEAIDKMNKEEIKPENK